MEQTAFGNNGLFKEKPGAFLDEASLEHPQCLLLATW